MTLTGQGANAARYWRRHSRKANVHPAALQNRGAGTLARGILPGPERKTVAWRARVPALRFGPGRTGESFTYGFRKLGCVRRNR